MRRKYEPELLDSFENIRRKQRTKRTEVNDYERRDKVTVAYNDVSARFLCFFFRVFFLNMLYKYNIILNI